RGRADTPRGGHTQPTQQFPECAGYAGEPGQQALDLRTAMFTMHAPLAEVLAVVAQHAIAVLSKARARPPNNLFTPQGVGPCGSNPYRSSVSEARERNFFHRAPAPGSGKGAIVNDGVGAHVDAMVRIGEARRNEVRTQRRLLICCQPPVATAKPPTT